MYFAEGRPLNSKYPSVFDKVHAIGSPASLKIEMPMFWAGFEIFLSEGLFL